MNSSIIRCLALLCVSVVLTGCGGGGKSGGPSSLGSNSITETRRAQIFTALEAKWKSLPRVSQSSDSQTLLKYMQTFPEFKQAGISADNSVWAKFPDGRIHVMANNEPYDQLTLPIHQNGSQGYTRSAVSRDTSSTAQPELPAGTAAQLYYMFGSVEGIAMDPRLTTGGLGQGIENMLKTVKGYDIDVAGYPLGVTIAQLRQPYRPAGTALLYTGTHGFLYPSNVHGPNQFALWTDQVVNPVLDQFDPLLQQDLAVPRDAKGNPIGEARVISAVADEVIYIGPSLTPLTYLNKVIKEVTHYAITQQFVKDYMKFTPGSIWYNDACDGATDPNFINAAFEKGLSTYLGWNMGVNRPASNNIARLFFDRLTGANLTTNWPEMPDQRPFDAQSVYDYMETNKISYSPGKKGDIVSTAHLELHKNSTSTSTPFGLVTPSIERLAVGGTSASPSLNIRGSFGTDPRTAQPSSDATVTIYPKGLAAGNGAPLTILAWSPSQIRCSIPQSGGDVVVTARQHVSNPRRLTEWKGALAYAGTGPANHQESFTMNLHILADIQSARSTIDQNLNGVTLQASSFNTLPDATCTYSNSGDWSEKLGDITWTGGGGLPPGGLGLSPGFHYEGTIDPVAKTMVLYFELAVPTGVTTTDKDANGNVNGMGSGGFSISTARFPNYVNSPALGKITFSLGDHQEINTKLITDSVTYSYNPLGDGTTNTALNSSTIPVTPGTEPDPLAARSVKSPGRGSHRQAAPR